MAALPTLPNRESYSTKDILCFLGKTLLAEKIPKEDQHKIPNKYIALYVAKDCAYAKAKQKTKHPDALLTALIRASSLKNNINQNPKTKTEYKLYLEQLEKSIAKADDQLDKIKKLDKKLTDHLSTWWELNRTNSNNLTRTGVTMESSIMTTAFDHTFKEINELLRNYEETSQAAEMAREGLVNTITSTEAVVPQQMVKDAATKAATLNPNAYEEQRVSTEGPSGDTPQNA